MYENVTSQKMRTILKKFKGTCNMDVLRENEGNNIEEILSKRKYDNYLSIILTVDNLHLLQINTRKCQKS